MSQELCGVGPIIDVSRMKSVLDIYSSCLNPPAFAERNRSYSDSQKRSRPRYLMASSNDLVELGGFGVGFSIYRSL